MPKELEEKLKNKIAKPAKKPIIRGRPTKYREKYCEEIIEFFSIPKTKQVIKAHITGKNGYEKDEYTEVANEMPFFSKFARKINVQTHAMEDWSKIYPNFSRAYNTAKEMQKEFLVDNGLRGMYPPASFIFTAKNITDMKDTIDVG